MTLFKCKVVRQQRVSKSSCAICSPTESSAQPKDSRRGQTGWQGPAVGQNLTFKQSCCYNTSVTLMKVSLCSSTALNHHLALWGRALFISDGPFALMPFFPPWHTEHRAAGSSSITLLCLDSNLKLSQPCCAFLSVVPCIILRALLLLSSVNTQKDCPKSKGLRLGNGNSAFKIRALPFSLNIRLYSIFKQQRPLCGVEIFVNLRRLSLGSYNSEKVNHSWEILTPDVRQAPAQGTGTICM